MARKYKPYPTRRQQKSRRMRNFALTLIGLIVAIAIFNRFYGADASPSPEQTNGSTVPVGDVLPSTGTETRADSEPITVFTPSLASAAEQPTPTPRPTPQPEASPQPVRETPSVTAPPAMVEPPAVVNAAGDESSPHAEALANEAMKLFNAGKIIQARELLNDTLNEQLSSSLRTSVKSRLRQLADKWLFSREVYPDDKLTVLYEVQKGDHLERIAKEHKVPYELLMQINGIARPELLQAGQRIKVIQGPFNAVVYKSNFTMDLYLQTKYIKTYRVGLGRAQYETPSGRWRVESDGKLIKPTWTDPDTGRTYVGDDPDYPLGSRWIALEGLEGAATGRTGFAIHGTKDPESIGTRSSRGCIRLYNGDVVEVYNLLYNGISEVLIMD